MCANVIETKFKIQFVVVIIIIYSRIFVCLFVFNTKTTETGSGQLIENTLVFFCFWFFM